MFNRLRVPDEYLVFIKTTKQDGFNRFWDAQGSTPLEVIEATLALMDNQDALNDLTNDEVDWIDVSTPTFMGNRRSATGNRGSWRDLDEDDEDYYWARRRLARTAESMLDHFERAGRYADLWDFEPFRSFTLGGRAEDDEPAQIAEAVRVKAAQFQAIVYSAPKAWARFQKRQLRKEAVENRRQAREDRKWERRHKKAVRRGQVATEPGLQSDVDMLDPHGDGTLREGDLLFDALMENKVIVGNRTPEGWILEYPADDNEDPSINKESTND